MVDKHNRNDNVTILQNIIITKLSESLNILLYLISFNYQNISIQHVHVTYNLQFLFILLGK